jgi:hypothetical protein
MDAVRPRAAGHTDRMNAQKQTLGINLKHAWLQMEDLGFSSAAAIGRAIGLARDAQTASQLASPSSRVLTKYQG